MTLADKFADLKRFQHILSVLFSQGFGHHLKKLKLKEYLPLHHRVEHKKFEKAPITPIQMRTVCEQLGGVFVKLGQFLSVRPDLLPPAYLIELEKLQDRVPVFPTDQAKEIVETSIKRPLRSVFKEFSEKPLASASISQVHKAVLKDGTEVAVKVKRPHIEELFKKDFEILSFFVNLLAKHSVTFRGMHPEVVLKEFKRWTENELDFVSEREHMIVIRHNLRDNHSVIVPKVYSDYCSNTVIVMDYVKGIELRDIDRIKSEHIDVDKVLTIGFNAILSQVFEHGIFHADPHPGNFLVVDSDHIAFVDFGIVGTFTEDMRDTMAIIYQGVVSNDPKLIVKGVEKYGAVNDHNVLEAEIADVIEPLQNAELKDIVVSEVLERVFKVILRHGFKIPLEMILFGKTIVGLEGIAMLYDPDFRITNKSKPFVKKLIKKKTSPKAILQKLSDTGQKFVSFGTSIPEKTDAFLKDLKGAKENMRYIDRDMRTMIVELNRSSNRVALGLIITGLIIASTLMLPYDQVTVLGISLFSFIGFFLTILLIALLVISILHEKKLT